MKARSVWMMMLAFALVLFLGANAEAQIPKQGTYTGWFGWHSFGQATDLGKGNLYWVGEFSGALANSAGSGFLHNTAIRCPGATVVVDGHAYYKGNCIVTDQDADSAFLVWDCDAKVGARCDGPMEWVGGTGKYKGIRGKHTFNGGFVGAGPEGYSVWKGEWRLPE